MKLCIENITTCNMKKSKRYKYPNPALHRLLAI